MKKLILSIIALLTVLCVNAQRKTDPLDRGLVAVKTNSGVFVSWRIQAEEYFDVKYNLYRDGTLIAKNLNVSNYQDNSGSASSTYTVKAVNKAGVEQAASNAASVWTTSDGTNMYKGIKMADVVDRDGNTVWSNNNGTVTYTQNYTVNDVSVGDVDGDGQIDFIVKRKNQTDQDNLFPTTNTTAFCHIEVYASSINYGLLWWIDCGPNIVYGSDEQWDAVAFDWDQDGRCEVLYRSCANAIIHLANGQTVNIGNMNENIRGGISHVANMTFTNAGEEWLLYINGATGDPYVTMEYPLKRLEDGETDLNAAWGDGYGHRSSKYFMGAPYLDGRNPSIFLGRGIYTRTKMAAYDVNPSTHQLTKRWDWANNTPGSLWYGQGYHNFSIADVDLDGCDEIIYGSMVIDNTGSGLSSTGLGHGDASHTGDLDPFRKGLETFACNEDEPANNYRNAATCEIYFRSTADDDDGRCMAGNFTNEYPGSIGASSTTGILALSAATVVPIDGWVNNWTTNTPNPMALNFCIYWDGDLLQETINGPGSNEGELFVGKNGSRIWMSNGAACNNGTKKNPSATGDILGDWREEIVMRSADNTEIRIYTTTIPTAHRIPSLWWDHEYRQAMVWQSEGYNQPPHTSYFLGEMEDITVAPVPYTMSGRTEISNSIPASANGKEVFVYNQSNVGIPTSGVSPSVLIVDAPTGTTTQLGYGDYKGDLTGDMRLVKQGEGLLKVTAKTFDYTGNSDVWAGSLYFRGTLTQSPLWMNRHTTLYTAGTFKQPVTMEYGSTLNINYDKADGTAEYTTATFETLNLHEGARVVFDIDIAGNQTDALNLKSLSIRKRDWQYGPQYLAPVLQINSASKLAIGTYPLGTVTDVDGDLEDVIVEGDFALGTCQHVIEQDGQLLLEVYADDTEYIGALDNSTGWWSAFSESYTLPSDWTFNFKFKNYGSADANWYNWVLVAANGSAGSADYAEYFALRADNYGWGDYYGTPSLTCTSSSDPWATFKTDMAAGADVDMNVLFKHSVLTLDATIVANGRTYKYTYASKEISKDEITLFFTVEKAHITVPVVEKIYTPDLTSDDVAVNMTYVNYDAPTTSYGLVETAKAGYNKLSGTTVGFAYTAWATDYITYLQVDLTEFKDEYIAEVILSFDGSGATDSKRVTSWGIGYNDSEWSSNMTYNSANKSITTVGDIKYGTVSSSTAYNTFSWDITDICKADEDGIITFVVYETAAAGGYVKNPKITVSYAATEEAPTNVVEGEAETIFAQDFEESDFANGWVIATPSRLTAEQSQNGKTGSCIWLKNVLAAGNNGTTATYTIPSNAKYNASDDYTFEFDFAQTSIIESSSTRNGNFQLLDASKNVLVTFKAFSGATEGSVTVGENTLATYSTSKGTYFLTEVEPTIFHHVVLKSNADGTTISIDGGNAVAVSSSFVKVASIVYNTDRYAGQLKFDNISISVSSPASLTLDPYNTNNYESGIYSSVTLNRTFNVGYSTICVPFNTTVSELTGDDTEAYVAYLSDVETNANGAYVLTFANTAKIKANKPYLIYVSKQLENPSVKDKAVYASSPTAITVGDWSMIGNYMAGKSMAGLYGVANNASIKKGGSNSTINGFTAFITGPANAQVKAKLSGMDDETSLSDISSGVPAIEGVYTLSGVRLNAPQKGINIIRMSDNTVRKVIVK